LLVSGDERFELFQRIVFATFGEKNCADRQARIIRDTDAGFLPRSTCLVSISRFVLAVECFQAAPFKVARGEGGARCFHLGRGAMKERQGGSVILSLKKISARP
jgi:hypothetical protein